MKMHITCLLILVFGSLYTHAQNEQRTCLVCGETPAKGDAHITYRGHDYDVCEPGCHAAWHHAASQGELDPIVQGVEPRAALFQGDSKYLNPTFQETHPIAPGVFSAGVLLLAAIVSAGLTGTLANRSHRHTPTAFLIGFVLPFVGIALVPILLKPRTGDFERMGSKIPRTRGELRCDTCGHALHPSASACPGCAGTQSPQIESEVLQVKRATAQLSVDKGAR